MSGIWVWHATCIFLGGLSIGFVLNDAVAKDLLRLAAWVAGLWLAAPVAACGSLDADLRRGLTVGIGHHPQWRGVLFPDKISPTMHMLCKALPPFQE
ncbi:MAG: hypothetical protein JZU64_00190 [Rhodoferax sp.]|jgi:hypothetical protein|nr:hypothetical protein [Rhodoferax sp.]